VLTWRFVTLSIKSALEYRADFFFMVAVGVIWQITVVAFATVLITRFPGMGGWEAGAVLLIAAVRMAGHTLAAGLFMGARQISQMTFEGRIDAFLLRPMPVYRQVMLNYFHVPEFGDLVVAAVMFGIAFQHLTLDWTPWRIAYLAAAVLGAMLLEAAVQTFLGSFALRHPMAKQWQEWTEDLMSTFGNYPLHILPGLARAVFVYLLPIALCGYFPVAVLTGDTEHLPVPTWVAAASPAISALLFLASLGWWSRQLRRYESVGG
jgi:ABC-2 type transport system permease protein